MSAFGGKADIARKADDVGGEIYHHTVKRL
jgi:hypothetical protein